MGRVATPGKRAGARRGPKKRARPNRRALLLALGITLCVVAWGYLVKTAVDFGSAARGGEQSAWGFLAIACVGAAACLFIGLILIAKMLRTLGITSGGTSPSAARGSTAEHPTATPATGPTSEHGLERTMEQPRIDRDHVESRHRRA